MWCTSGWGTFAWQIIEKLRHTLYCTILTDLIQGVVEAFIQVFKIEQNYCSACLHTHLNTVDVSANLQKLRLYNLWLWHWANDCVKIHFSYQWVNATEKKMAKATETLKRQKDTQLNKQADRQVDRKRQTSDREIYKQWSGDTGNGTDNKQMHRLRE